MKDSPRITDDEARIIFGVITWITVSGTILGLFLGRIPSENRDLIIALSSSMAGAFVGTMNFFNKAGVSNDRQKDDTINKLVSKSPTE